MQRVQNYSRISVISEVAEFYVNTGIENPHAGRQGIE
jgi:hypothetical protein